MEKKKWTQWIYWFTLGLAIVFVYKTLDSFTAVMDWLKGIFNVLMPFIIAILIAYIFYIPARKLENAYSKASVKWFAKRAKGFSVLSIYLIAMVLLISIIKFVVPSISDSVKDLINSLPGYYNSAIEYVNNLPEDSVFCRNYADNFFVLIRANFRPILEDYVLTATNIQPKLLNLLPEHYQLEFSAGVYVIDNLSEKIDTMLENANMARHVGKFGLNPNRITYFTKEMRHDSEHDKYVTLDMNRAFNEHEFEVFFQPKFNFQTGEVIGAEALIRWNHKTKGLLPPAQFVPLFEKNGFIQKIDMLVFERVCQFLDKYNKSGPDGSCPRPITISCNLSRYQLYNPTFASEYSKIFSKYQIEPSKIELELTESLMMDNKKRLLKAMNEIKKAGFDISVDDFGSGFSSLSLLKDIPASVIKLDKEFFANSANSSGGKDIKKDNIIVNSVIDMAKKLSMTTVAEGVEEEAQAQKLKEMGCDIAQGYFYAKPMSEADFERLLKNSL